jgi:hypothetical protein
MTAIFRRCIWVRRLRIRAIFCLTPILILAVQPVFHHPGDHAVDDSTQQAHQRNENQLSKQEQQVCSSDLCTPDLLEPQEQGYQAKKDEQYSPCDEHAIPNDKFRQSSLADLLPVGDIPARPVKQLFYHQVKVI